MLRNNFFYLINMGKCGSINVMKILDIRENLQKNLRQNAEYMIYNRGLNYYNLGYVQSIKVSARANKILIEGRVSGTRDYTSKLNFDIQKDEFSGLNCTCPYGSYCKHSIALGLYFISRYCDAIEKYDDYGLNEIIDHLNEDQELHKVSSRWNMDERKVDLPNNKLGNYRIILSDTLDYLSFEIISGKNYRLSAREVMMFDKNLSDAHKKVFKQLEMYSPYYDGNKYWQLFELLQKSALPIYWEEEDKKNELCFVEKSKNNKKLKAELVKQKDIYDEENDKICFKLDKSYFNRKLFKLLESEKGLVVLEWNKISFVKMPAILMSIINRAYKENYYFTYQRDSYKTDLSEDEIVNLNKILDISFKYLDFSTNLEKHYNIQKLNLAEQCIIIDYDSENDTLEAKAMVDYGIKKIDVAKSVHRSYNREGNTFNRWGADKYVIDMDGDNISYAPVRKRLEISTYKTILSNCQEYGFRRSIKCKLGKEKDIYKFIDKNLPNLEKLNYRIEYVRDKPDLVENKFNADFDVDLNTENDWLSFDVACYCGEDKINLDVLKNYVKGKVKNGYIKLDGGRLWKVSNEEELERFILMLEAFYKSENNKFEGRIYHAPEIEALFENSEYYKGKLSESFKTFMHEVKSGKSVEKVKLPARFDGILRDYQKDGVDWFYFLRKYRFGGILADDMGTGKTLQTLALLNMNRNKEKPSIVICPKTLLYNWIAEVEKFTPKFKAIVLDGMQSERMKKIKESSKYDLVITSYSTMQRDFDYYEKHKIKFNYCVLDEAQFIKNHKTKNAQTVKKIDADYRLVLTGTPLENSVSEIWSIFDFLMPGFLGQNKLFVSRFQNPIMKRNCRESLKNLRKKIECFMLRRTKEEVLKELPPKIEQYNYCHLEPSQNILYQEILANVKNEIFKTVDEKGFAKSQIHILAGLTKLRQVCNHPNLLLRTDDYTKYESAKLNMFRELINEIVSSGRKVLVFSQFTTMLDILSQELGSVPHNYLSGKTKNRQELVDDFNNNEEKKVFLISLKAGGVGLNLTSADNVIIFDPWWNPSVERQAVDRTHRIGQTKSVNVYRFITNGTIEEKIIKLQERKKFLFDNLVSESQDLFKKLTWEDVKELFK
ncbi:hypothetical protein D4R87_02410 [bacterium]|nr:MAG: hypothetical protein D4R87_02410 [bacterium]